MRWDRVTEILAVVNGRWSVPILRHLGTGITRPGALLKAVNETERAKLSSQVMFEALDRLVTADMIVRHKVAGFPRETHYYLTPAGREILDEISRLGARGGRVYSVSQDPPPVQGVDPTKASPARIWNVLIGGKDHFASDREAAAAAVDAMPYLPEIARQVRLFQASAVRRLTGLGVRQFLDIGTGLPVAGSVHEIAQQDAPGSRVVYVDNDPMVLAHARALLTSSPEGACDYIDADLRNPGEILARAAETLDFRQPVAVLLIAMLHFLSDEDDPRAIVSRLMQGVTGDAYLAVSHAASDLEPAGLVMAGQYNTRSSVPIWMRSRAQVAEFFGGLEMLPPGLVTLGQWFPDQVFSAQSADMAGHVGIGWRPGGRGRGTAAQPGGRAGIPERGPSRPKPE